MIIYKPIPKFEGIYEAGSDGSIWTALGKTTVRTLADGTKQKRIWKRRKLKPKVEKRVRSTSFDKRVDLWKEGQHKTFLVSILIATAFLDNPENLPCINHLDGNPLNNSVKNLEWCTYERNVNHAFLNGLNQNVNEIVLVDMETKESNYFVSKAAASAFLKKNKGYLSALIKRGKTTVDGYKIFINSNLEDKYV